MTAKATSLVGLDVHARETHAAILHLDSGELAVSRLRMAPLEVVGVLERLGPGVVALPPSLASGPALELRLLPGRLEQLDWIAGRILNQDLPAADTGDDVVAEPGVMPAKLLDGRVEISQL